MEAFKSFKSTGVLVFANSKNGDYQKLPAGVKEVRAKGGNTLPMVFVTTADGSKGIDGIPYATLKDDCRKAARELKKTLAEVDILGEGSADTDSDDSESTAEVRDWTNSDGKTITASVKSIDGDKVQFELESGKLVWYPIAKLSEESQEQLKEEKE